MREARVNMINRPSVRVAVAQFEDIVAHGLRALITEDDSLDLVADGVPHDELKSALSTHTPDVAILNFGSLTSASELRDLHHKFPEARLVVLANRPTPSECRQMLAFGATACLAKSTEARDVLHAIHLASRGLHVLPPAGMEPADLRRPGPAHAARGRGDGAAPERALQRRDRPRSARQRRDRPHPRAADLPKARASGRGASCAPGAEHAHQGSP